MEINMGKQIESNKENGCVWISGSFPKWGYPNVDPHTIIRIIGTPRRVPLILGNPHLHC